MPSAYFTVHGVGTNIATKYMAANVDNLLLEIVTLVLLKNTVQSSF